MSIVYILCFLFLCFYEIPEYPDSCEQGGKRFFSFLFVLSDCNVFIILFYYSPLEAVFFSNKKQ